VGGYNRPTLWREGQELEDKADNQDKVDAFVPSAQRTKLSPESAAASQKVREALNDLSRSEARRRRMIEDLRFRMEADDIRISTFLLPLMPDDAILEETAAMFLSAPADFEDFFSRRLESHYAENQNECRLDQAESGKLRARLREANSNFVKSRRTDTSLEDRERALQKLETGYLKFLEIAQNLDEGRKFYNELARMLGRWREEIRGFVYQRKKEARDLEEYGSPDLELSFRDLSADMLRLKISDGKAKAPVSERRTSLRTTRSVSRQMKENVDNESENNRNNGDNVATGMWTPGTINL
jgi:hypothetical protein